MEKKKLLFFIGSPVLGRYINGNHSVTLWADGSKHRATGHWEDKKKQFPFFKRMKATILEAIHRKPTEYAWVKDDQDHLYFDFPENFDIKITDYCDPVQGRMDGGICAYCHENSSPNGKHGDLRGMEAVFRSLHPGTECACLKGDTIVYTPMGSKEIKDLQMGDAIFNAVNGVSIVKKITKTIKPVCKIKFNRGLVVESSADHPFMSDGREVCAENMPNKLVDTLPMDTCRSDKFYSIDMAQYIHPANSESSSSRGGRIIGENEIRLTNSSMHSARYVTFDADMAYLYGWFVAEGSRSSLTMCSDEVGYADTLGKIWASHTRLPFKITCLPKAKSLNLELKNRTFVQHLMFDALQVGHGAKNKNLSFLYKISNAEVIRSALLGLFLGDGCFRNKTVTRNGRVYTTKMISLKTTSKRLAYDVLYLLKKWFGIAAGLSTGVTKRGRPIDGRVLPDSRYYMIEVYDNTDTHKLFPEHFELISRHAHYAHREFKCISCTCDDLEYKESLYDITLSGETHTFPVNGYIITHNCGGGNALAHPDLMWLLNVLKEQGVVANITVNQRHLQKYREMLLQLVNDKLVHGIGVSLTDSANQDDLKIVEELGKNVVIHVIAGIFSEKDIPFVKGRKMLILGYKDLRRGHSLLEHHSEDIKAKIQWLKEYLPTLKDETKLISFDCLGIEQIDPKTVLKLSDDEFNYLYQGSDTDVFDSEGHIACSTMYIDVPNMTVARMSTASLDKRFPFTGKENISDLLKLTTQGW